MTSPEGLHDNDAFTVRLNVTDESAPFSDKLQVISVSSFGEIRLMTLNQSFVEKFYERESLPGLTRFADSASSASNEDSAGSDKDIGKAGKGKRGKAAFKALSPKE